MKRSKKRSEKELSLKVSQKGGVSVYGLGRFPVTLYKEQWEKLLEMTDDIRAFIQENKAQLKTALLHGPEQIADLPVPVAESPGAVRIGHPERSHLVEYLAPNSVFNSLPRQRSSPHLRPDDRLVTIDRVLHHASLGVA